MKQKIDTKTVDLEDVLVWSDGTWCYRYELWEMTHMSDDFSVLYFGTDEYWKFFETEGK